MTVLRLNNNHVPATGQYSTQVLIQVSPDTSHSSHRDSARSLFCLVLSSLFKPARRANLAHRSSARKLPMDQSGTTGFYDLFLLFPV